MIFFYIPIVNLKVENLLYVTLVLHIYVSYHEPTAIALSPFPPPENNIKFTVLTSVYVTHTYCSNMQVLQKLLDMN